MPYGCVDGIAELVEGCLQGEAIERVLAVAFQHHGVEPEAAGVIGGVSVPFALQVMDLQRPYVGFATPYADRLPLENIVQRFRAVDPDIAVGGMAAIVKAILVNDVRVGGITAPDRVGESTLSG